jgi:Holliday junction DNA helicase RuvA
LLSSGAASFEKRPNQVIVDVNGVGYNVQIPVSTFYQLPDRGSEAQLFIYTHVREDVLALYGFRTEKEKALFEKVISVSGIGPRLAVTLLSGMDADEL